MTKYSKVDVLLVFWEKLFIKIQMQASKLKDTKVNSLLNKIAQVPGEVKVHLLKHYVIKCRELHSVAFL